MPRVEPTYEEKNESTLPLGYCWSRMRMGPINGSMAHFHSIFHNFDGLFETVLGHLENLMA